jgi:membrane protease YdiL (CAAX protease family)
MTAERKSGVILAVITALEGGWVVMNLQANGWGFIRYLGFAPGLTGNLAGWVGALFATTIFVALGLRLPSVRENLFRPSFLKLLAIALAISAGILEEVMFRRWTMNWLMARGYGPLIQVLGAGLLFGAIHGIWGVMGGSFRAAVGATVATGFLGLMLAMVYLLAGRSLAPCISAHFLINLLVEPGLVLAATRGEMGSRAVEGVNPER